MAINVGPSVRKPNYHFSLFDGSTRLGLLQCNQQGIVSERAGWRQSPMPNTAMKLAQGQAKYEDFELPFTSIIQQDWGGGMNAQDFEDDKTKYRDGRFCDTSRGDIICGPKPVSTLEAYEIETEGGLSYDVKRENHGQDIFSTFTPSENMTVVSVTIPVDESDTSAEVTIWSETSPGSGVRDTQLAYGQITISGVESVTIVLEGSVALTADTNYLIEPSSSHPSGYERYYTRDETGETVYREDLVGWEEEQPAGDADKQWTCFAMTPDGGEMIAGVNSGRLYLYKNGYWSETRPLGDIDAVWKALSINSDGSVIIAHGYANRTNYLYIYKNGAWSRINDFVNGVECSAMSSDGSVIAIESQKRLYLSTDTGATWSEVQPGGDNDLGWKSVDMSDNGSAIFAVCEPWSSLGGDSGEGRCYLSTDTGTNWSEVQPAGDVSKMWFTASVDSDGSVLMAGIYGGRIYLSTDSGSTWSEIQPAGDVNKGWVSSAISSDGSIIILGSKTSSALGVTGRLYVSEDGGSTWSEEQPAGDVDKDWLAADLDDTGSIRMAGVSVGRLYLYVTDGSLSDTQMAFLMNYREDVEVYWHFFEYRRAMYAFGNKVDGSAPVLYRNGYRGAGKSNSADKSKLNTDQDLEDVDLTGCIALIIEGPGVKERQPWRVIKSNTVTGTDDVISVEQPWNIAHTTATSWVVLGSDDWVEISGHGLTGQVMSVAVLKDYVLFAQGEDINIRRMNEYNNAGVWTTRYEADGTAKADLVLANPNTEGVEKVWKITVNKNVANSATVADWGTAHSWGDDIAIGSKDSDIKGLIAYGDPLIPYVIKEDSFGSIQNDIYAEVPIGEMAAIRSEYNGITSMMHAVYLYFNMGEKIERYYDRRLDDVGPDRDEGMKDGRQGIVRKLLPYPGRFYALLYTDGQTPSILCFNGMGWNEVWRGVSVNSDGSGATGQAAAFAYNVLDQANVMVSDLIVQVIPGQTIDRLWFDHGSAVKRLPITVNPRRDSAYQYRDLAHMETCWIYGNLKDVNKYWHSIKMHTENLSGADTTARTIRVEYKVDNDTSWTVAGYVDTSPIEELDLSSAYDVTGYRIKFRFTLHTDDASETPRIVAVVIKGVVRVEAKKGWTVTVLSNPDVDLNGETSDQGDLMSQLDTWANSDETPAPLILRHNIEKYDSKYVFIDPSSVSPTQVELNKTNNQATRQYQEVASFTLYEV